MLMIHVDVLKSTLSRPFVSNKGTVTGVAQAFVRIESRGQVGYGAATGAAPDPSDCPHLSATCLDDLLTKLGQCAADEQGWVVALEMAALDLFAKLKGKSLSDLWQLPLPRATVTGFSLSAGRVCDVVAQARAMADWPVLKLKLSKDMDLATVGAVRAVFPGRIWVDANGAWSLQEALQATRLLAAYDVELLEQPVAVGTSESAWLALRASSSVRLVADEDCRTLADIERLAGCVDAVNIKLTKCGGLRRAYEMMRLARKRGLRVMLGCKTESALGVAAASQLAGLADYVDLDGHLDIEKDAFAGIAVETGRIVATTAYGVGARPSRVGHDVGRCDAG